MKQLFKEEKSKNAFKVGSALLVVAMLIILGLWVLPSLLTGTLTFINVLQPFIIAFVIAYFMNPVWEKSMKFIRRSKFFDKHIGLSKFITLTVLYLLFLTLLIGAFVFIIPEVIDSVVTVTSDLPKLYADFKKEMSVFFAENDIVGMLSTYTEKYSGTITSFLGDVVSVSKDSAEKVVTTVLDITTIIKDFFLGLFISIYMLLYKEKAKDGIYRLMHAYLPEKARNMINHFAHCLNVSFSGFVLTQALNSFIVGVVCFTLMSIFGMPYALLSSVFVGICNMIPIFGQFVGAVPGAVLLLFTDINLFWGFIIMIVCIQQFECHILTPSMVSAKISIPPIWVIFGVIVCGGLMGVIGFFIGVPIVAVIYTLINENVDNRLDKKGLSKHLQEKVIDEKIEEIK